MRMKIHGSEFNLLWTLLERWTQTFAVLYFHGGMMFYGIIFVLFCILLLYLQLRQLYIIPILYMSFIVYDRNASNRGGRQREWYRRLKLWEYFRDYFPVRMIKTSELSPSKNYIVGYHPHGILCSGILSTFGTESTNFKEVFPGITPRFLVLNGTLLHPIAREHLLWGGACSVSKESIEWLLTKEGTGNAIVLPVGGAAEALEAHPGSATLVLRNRKGFIKLALKHGASLVPVFVFGENEIFNQVPNPEGSVLRKIQSIFLKTFGFATPFFYGRGFFPFSFGFLPYRKPMHVVIGKPIDLEADPEPSQEKIDTTHQMYVDGLTELFEEHKIKYGPDLQLKIK